MKKSPSSSAAEQVFREAAVGCLDGLYGFALTLCRDLTTAEDLVQETYVRALRARNKPVPQEGLRSWLFTILHNVWRDELRRRRPEALKDDSARVEWLPAREVDLLQSVERAQVGGRLLEAVEDLPAPFREVIVLRWLEGFSYREMAEILGCPAGTVMSRLARARARLRRSLDPVRLVAGGRGRP